LWFALLHLAWFAAWIAVNAGLLPIVPAFDRYPFPFLAMVVAPESVLLTAFVLIKQQRMACLSDRRAHFDLQVNLLTEREVTRVLRIVERLARRLDVEHETIPSPELSHETEIEHVAEHWTIGCSPMTEFYKNNASVMLQLRCNAI
jgi:uncharacterized membrane protein